MTGFSENDQCDPAGMVRPDHVTIVVAEIDCALARFSQRDLVSASEVSDLLLDIRSALGKVEVS